MLPTSEQDDSQKDSGSFAPHGRNKPLHADEVQRYVPCMSVIVERESSSQTLEEQLEEHDFSI